MDWGLEWQQQQEKGVAVPWECGGAPWESNRANTFFQGLSTRGRATFQEAFPAEMVLFPKAKSLWRPKGPSSEEKEGG